jgi:pyruvate carboxylase
MAFSSPKRRFPARAVAEQCVANDITFVGPPAAALALFGDKVRFGPTVSSGI